MKMIEKLYTEHLSEAIGYRVDNIENINILELDEESIVELYKSGGLLYFRDFETNFNIF